MAGPVGIYVSIPFCKAKCTFCNFASEAFPPSRMQAYVDRLTRQIRSARELAAQLGAHLPQRAETVFFGGGTPSLLSPEHFRALMAELRDQFLIDSAAEITLEAAPGQIAEGFLAMLAEEGVNRVSLGVQSFVDKESRAVGRLHTADACLRELERLAAAGIRNRNVDLIAGLPHQDAVSWQKSLDTVAGSGAEHVSVYMLEIDEDSRLGREVAAVRFESQLEVLGQQARYSAAAVPSDEQCADLYAQACDFLDDQAVVQYEISNFAREGYQSRHNRKYWTREPYLGFGLDAHSMLAVPGGKAALRFARTDDLEIYLARETTPEVERVEGLAAFEEEVFLGLRLSEGIDLDKLRNVYGVARVADLTTRSKALEAEGIMFSQQQRLYLTARGRMLSSSVFGELLGKPVLECGIEDHVRTERTAGDPRVSACT